MLNVLEKVKNESESDSLKICINIPISVYKTYTSLLQVAMPYSKDGQFKSKVIRLRKWFVMSQACPELHETTTLKK